MTDNIYAADNGLAAPCPDAGGVPDWVRDYSAQLNARPDFTAIAWGLPPDTQLPPGGMGGQYLAPAFTVPVARGAWLPEHQPWAGAGDLHWMQPMPPGSAVAAYWMQQLAGRPDVGFLDRRIGWSPERLLPEPRQLWQPGVYRPDPTQVFDNGAANFYRFRRWQTRPNLDPSLAAAPGQTGLPGFYDGRLRSCRPCLPNNFPAALPGWQPAPFYQRHPGSLPQAQPFFPIGEKPRLRPAPTASFPETREPPLADPPAAGQTGERPANRLPADAGRPDRLRPIPSGDFPQPLPGDAVPGSGPVGMGYFITRDGRQFTQDYVNGQVQPYTPLPFVNNRRTRR